MDRHVLQLALGASLLALALAPASLAQGSEEALKREIEALKKGQQDIQKQLQEIKRLIQAQPTRSAPAAPDVSKVVLNLGDNSVQGVAAAKLTLVEFTDYQ